MLKPRFPGFHLATRLVFIQASAFWKISSLQIQYTKRVFTIFRVGFGVATLCLAQSQWFHGGVHREFQVIQRNSQRDEERGVIIDFREMGCFYCDTVSVRVRARNTVSVSIRARNL